MLFFCDIDGVLLDLAVQIQREIEKRCGYQLDDIYCYSFEEAYGLPDSMLGPSTDPPNDVWKSIWERPAEPYPAATDFIESLRQRKIQPIGLSHRVGTLAQEASLRDLRAAGLIAGIDLDVWFVDRPEDKYGILNGNKCLGYVDDMTRMAANVAELGIPTFLISQPWNQFCLDVGKYIRVKSLVQILWHIDQKILQ